MYLNNERPRGKLDSDSVFRSFGHFGTKQIVHIELARYVLFEEREHDTLAFELYVRVTVFIYTYKVCVN